MLQVGRDRRNQAIVALAVRAGSSGVTRSVFISVANLDIESAQRRLQLYGDGVLLEARDIILDPQTRSEAIIDDIPVGVRVVEVRLDGDADPSGDVLALDDRAWAIVPPDRLRRVLLVSAGDPYLETALAYLPNTELYGVAPRDYGPATHPELFDLVIFEGDVPAELPPAAVLAIAPKATSSLGEVTGTLKDPGIGSLDPDEPILRYVDLSTTHIGTATKLALPAWARAVIPGSAGAPLLYAGELEGRRAAVLAFEPRLSDLPLQVAFPILLANLAGELMGGSAAPTEAVAPGDPVSLPLPAGATALEVTRPDGTVVELTPGTPGAGGVQFSGTEQLGVYSAVAVYAEGTPTPAPTPSATPGGSAPAGASPTPSASAGGSPTPVPTAPPADPGAPTRFAVDLFDPAESNIAPGSVTAIEALGGAAANASPAPDGSASPTGSPSASGGGAGATTEERPPARDELWIPIVLLALAALLAEWLVYQRDAVMRLWRGLRARLGRADAAPAGGPRRGA